MAVLSKQAKQRRRVLSTMKRQADLILLSLSSVSWLSLERHLPQMMSRAEIEVVAAGVIEELKN